MDKEMDLKTWTAGEKQDLLEEGKQPRVEQQRYAEKKL
jgi:hypothetical protein